MGGRGTEEQFRELISLRDGRRLSESSLAERGRPSTGLEDFALCYCFSILAVGPL